MRLRNFATRLAVVLLFLAFYFMILAPFLPSIENSVVAWIEAHSTIFKYNTTIREYQYVNNTLVETVRVQTVDYTPLLTFAIRILFVLAPLLVVWFILFGRW